MFFELTVMYGRTGKSQQNYHLHRCDLHDFLDDHDILSELTVMHGRTGKTPKCCDGGFGGNHPNCLPIEIPKEDQFYKLHQRRCMNFVRSQVGVEPNRNQKTGSFQELLVLFQENVCIQDIP